jgi:odorant receptor
MQVKDKRLYWILTAYLMSMVLQIFLPCYYGNELSAASEKLSLSVFDSSWNEESEEFKTAMKIFMENTKKPLKISALGTFHLNLENFLKIMNSAYSVSAVLTSLKGAPGSLLEALK